MFGPWVHNIDPIIGTVGGMHLWWYGLSYSLGFLNAHFFLRRHRERLGLSRAEVYELSLLLAAGVLAGGRSLVVFRHEWSFYREHLSLAPALWLGGLATHGLIVGGLAGVLLFCVIRHKPFRPMFDALAVPAAMILGAGRIGNFIDGQIVGGITSLPWGVQFPDTDGFRHPVVLYDGLKNFAMVPVLLWVRRQGVPPGRIAALFILLYAALRIPIDMLREYPTAFLYLPAGQAFNMVMALAGAALLMKNWLRPPSPVVVSGFSQSAKVRLKADTTYDDPIPAWQAPAFAALVAFALVIPSDATRNVPERYGKRHAGLQYSALYPQLVEPQRAEALRSGQAALTRKKE